MNFHTFRSKFVRQCSGGTVVSGNMQAFLHEPACQCTHTDATDAQEINIIVFSSFTCLSFINTGCKHEYQVLINAFYPVYILSVLFRRSVSTDFSAISFSISFTIACRCIWSCQLALYFRVSFAARCSSNRSFKASSTSLSCASLSEYHDSSSFVNQCLCIFCLMIFRHIW